MSKRLTLFISGDSSENRCHAVAIRLWCDQHLGGRYQLEVRDILDHPHELGQTQVLATPLLVLESPPARVVGDLSDVSRVMAALGLGAVEMKTATVAEEEAGRGLRRPGA
jgi:circadian clock protein KaiB